jgi:NAD(P)-dependent dehydrogenase (short-subunit alcohol dehydrogenase family)
LIDENIYAIEKDMKCRTTVVVHAAGLTMNELLVSSHPEQINQLMALNLHAPIEITKGLLRGMLRERNGSIVHVSSIIGSIMGNSSQSVYAASKAGLVGFTKSLAKEVGRKGIRVNAILPGFVDTNMTEDISPEKKASYLNQIPLNRFGTAEEIAEAVHFLVHAPYITGSCLVVDGGMTA